MYKLTTYTELEIAHRLMTSYETKCRSLHGHRYEVEITVSAEALNDDNMIVDFKKLKEIVKRVLDDRYDHGTILNNKDKLSEYLLADKNNERLHIINCNPTLEWMVKHWYYELADEFKKENINIKVYSIKASETAKNTCEYMEG